MDNSFSLIYGKVGKRYRIVDILSPTSVRRRLFEMGFTTGTNVGIVKKSIKGGVYLLSLRSFLLAVKGEEVSHIMVKDE